MAKLEEEGDIAADYLEGLLDIADLDGDIDIDVENGRASLAIVGGKLKHLVGNDGEVLDAIQELTRLAVQTSTGDRSRLMLDIDGFRAGRRKELTALAEKMAEEAKTTGSSIKLDPMNAFERKIIHDTIQTLGSPQNQMAKIQTASSLSTQRSFYVSRGTFSRGASRPLLSRARS